MTTRKHYAANRAGVLAANKAWRQANIDQVRARDRARYYAKREEKLAGVKAYRERNRDAINASKRTPEARARARALAAAEPADVKAERLARRRARRDPAKARAYYLANRDAILAKDKARREADPATRAAIKARWVAANPEQAGVWWARRRANLAGVESAPSRAGRSTAGTIGSAR